MNFKKFLIQVLSGPNDAFRGSIALDSFAPEQVQHMPWLKRVYTLLNMGMLALRWLLCAAQRGLAMGMNAIIDHEVRTGPVTASAQRFRGIHKGERCFVLANGSSLRKQDIAPLANEKTIAIGTYWRHEQTKVWQPTYYTMVDAHLFTPERDLIPGTTLKTFPLIAEAIHDSTFFFPREAHGFFEKHPLLPKEQLNYVQMLPQPLYEAPARYPDFARAFPWVQDSSQFAIMLGMALGFKEIILLGCDHDWYVNRGIEKHFFDGPARGEAEEVFDSASIPYMQSAWFGWVLWRGHMRLRALAESRGVKIVNATGGGVLDAYPLASYEKLVGLK